MIDILPVETAKAISSKKFEEKMLFELDAIINIFNDNVRKHSEFGEFGFYFVKPEKEMLVSFIRFQQIVVENGYTVRKDPDDDRTVYIEWRA